MDNVRMRIDPIFLGYLGALVVLALFDWLRRGRK